MSAADNSLKSAVAAVNGPSKPLIAPTGNASVDVLVGDLNQVAAPFQELSNPDATDLDKANGVIGGILSAIQAPETLANDGFALLTKDIAKLFPGMPAATLGMMHLGIPHLHTHPPAMPVPLPSLGPVVLAGCASVRINNVPAARAGDTGIALICGSLAPPFEVFTGSSSVFIGGARAARMLDITRHCQPGAGVTKGASMMQKLGGAAKQMLKSPGGILGVVGLGAGVLGAVAAEESANSASDEQEAALGHGQAKMMGIQAGLDAAAMAMGLLMGLDPGATPCFGALLTGMPNVLIGGFPMPPWMEIARGLRKLGKGLKKKAPRLLPKLKCMFTGHPIDPVTGDNVDTFIDFDDLDSPIGFRWSRHYTSADVGREGPMGRGFRHSYEHSLALDMDRVVYTDAEGKPFEFPAIAAGEPAVSREGYVLEARSEGGDVVYEVSRAGDPTMEFVRRSGRDMAPRLVRLIVGQARAELTCDEHGRLARMLETGPTGARETRFEYDERGHLVEVRRGAPGEAELPVIASYGYDHAGCLTAWQDALGARGSYAYDEGRRIVRMTDRNGYSFHFAYDPEGRCVEEHGDDGRWRVALRYEPEKRRTLVTKADGGEWIYEYDEHGTLVARQDPYGGRQVWVLGEDGRIVKELGADGQTNLRFLHDRDGLHYGVVDRYGHHHPPLDEEPNPPDPLAIQIPNTPVSQQWGAALDELPATEPARSPLRPSVPSQRRDACGRVIEAVDAAGHREACERDASGNETRRVDRDGREHRTEITSWNLLGAEVDPLGQRTRFDYTKHAKISRIVDPGGSESRYEYDLKDRLVRVVRHGVVHDEYVYDAGDRLIEKRDGAGNVLLRRTIGNNGLPAERRLASGQVYRYEHDEGGQVTRVFTDETDVRRDFDEQGRLTRDERDERGVRHRFEGPHLCETTYLGRFTAQYRCAPDGSLLIEAPVGGVQRLYRSVDGSVVTELGNGTTALGSYDEDGRCLGRELRRTREGKLALWNVRYEYSAEGDLLRVEDNARGVTEYAYDAAHRLIGEKRPDGVVLPIVLDAAGNVLEKPGLARAALVEGNRLRAAEGEQFSYDLRNHLGEQRTADGRAVRYRYDSSDMLVEVAWSGRDEVWTAGYDGLRRRVFKALGEARTEYFWDEHRLAAEVGPAGALRVYVYPGPDALVPLMFIDYDSVEADPASGRAYYPIGNQIGVPLHVEDQEGKVVWRAEHVEPYGLLSVRAGASLAYAPRFPGHFFDEETGLHYNRFRYYSPRLGRYLQSDPIGQGGGINLYGYPADPLGHVDVLGLTKVGFYDPRLTDAEVIAHELRHSHTNKSWTYYEARNVDNAVTDHTTATHWYRAMTPNEFAHLENHGQLQLDTYGGISPSREYSRSNTYFGNKKPATHVVEFNTHQMSLYHEFTETRRWGAKAEDGIMSFGLGKTGTAHGEAGRLFNEWLAANRITWRLVDKKGPINHRFKNCNG